MSIRTASKPIASFLSFLLMVLSPLGAAQAQELPQDLPPPPPQAPRVNPYTQVPIRITQTINSEAGYMGTQGTLGVVDRDVVGPQGVIIRAGTAVALNVDLLARAAVGEPGQVRIVALETSTVDGQPLPLQGYFLHRGRSRKGASIGVAVGVGIFVLPMALFLLLRGKSAVVPAGTVFNAAVAPPPTQVAPR